MSAGERLGCRRPPWTSARREIDMNATVLWLIAVALVVIGVVQLIQGQLLLAVVLFVAAALVGPGGYSIFRTRA